jgi:hypothetical protein
MTADEVRAELEEELGGSFAEATWKRLYNDEVKWFLEDQRSETWRDVKERAEDLFEYEKELRQELASDASMEARSKLRRLGQRKNRQDQETAEEHWFPQLTAQRSYVPKSMASISRRSLQMTCTWLGTARACSVSLRPR